MNPNVLHRWRREIRQGPGNVFPVAKLLSEAKTLTFHLKKDAVTMESYTRMNVSWESHAAAINQNREHVNALGRQVTKLKDARNTASPWQKTAFDRITWMGWLTIPRRLSNTSRESQSAPWTNIRTIWKRTPTRHGSGSNDRGFTS